MKSIIYAVWLTAIGATASLAQPDARTLQTTYSPAEGLGPQEGVMRRDPSDIIKVGGLYYVWNHEVLVWPQGTGVAAMIGTTGPEEITQSILYAEDGLHFTKTQDLINVPHAAGAYRPEAFTDSGKGGRIEWGVHIGAQNFYRRRLYESRFHHRCEWWNSLSEWWYDYSGRRHHHRHQYCVLRRR